MKYNILFKRDDYTVLVYRDTNQASGLDMVCKIYGYICAQILERAL